MAQRIAELFQTGGYNAPAGGPPMLNPGVSGGYHGWVPDIANLNSMAAHVHSPLVAVLWGYPKIFDYFPNPDAWRETLKVYVESHVEKWEGFTQKLSVEFDDSRPVGGAGEKHQEVVKVSRERTQPKSSSVDFYGLPMAKFFDYWIRYALMDPDANFPLASTLGQDITDLLPDMKSMTMLFFEPDKAFKKVQMAWLCTNMMPDTSGTLEGKKVLTDSHEIARLDINWTSITDSGEGVKALAQSVLNSINIRYADPRMREVILAQDTNILAASDVGYKAFAESVGRNRVGQLG